MADKSLKNKAVSIKGKDYVLVSDRVVYFNETYPNGGIFTSYKLDGDTYHFKAEVTPDYSTPDRKFTGHSQATIGEGMVNKTAAMENAETSAVGRALGMMGIGVIESIASADEMNKATYNSPSKPRNASMKQIELMVNKVKWGLNLHDKDEVIRFLDAVTGKPLTEIKSNEVDEVLEKITKAIREEKVHEVAKVNTEEVDIVHPDTGEPITLDNLPY